MSKRGKRVAKRFSDQWPPKGENVSKNERIPEEKKTNKEIINFKNTEGWELYRTATDNAADDIAAIANNMDLTIDEEREKLFQGKILFQLFNFTNCTKFD